MAKEQAPFDEATYRNARSTRPGWANALIVAGVLFLVWIAVVLTGGFSAAWIFLLASFVTAVIAGILALTGVRRK